MSKTKTGKKTTDRNLHYADRDRRNMQAQIDSLIARMASTETEVSSLKKRVTTLEGN